MDKTENASGTPAEGAEPKKKQPYRTPEVVTRPLFERMALGCANPEQGDPY